LEETKFARENCHLTRWGLKALYSSVKERLRGEMGDTAKKSDPSARKRLDAFHGSGDQLEIKVNGIG